MWKLSAKPQENPLPVITNEKERMLDRVGLNFVQSITNKEDSMVWILIRKGVVIGFWGKKKKNLVASKETWEHNREACKSTERRQQ